MGQQASLLEDKTFETQAISFQRDKISFARKNPSFMESIESQDSCMNYFCSFHPKQPEKWKVEALKHLKSLKSQYWPELLTKILKQTTNEKLDLIYKADMYYMINKSNLSALSPIKESSPSFKDSFKSSRPDIKFSTSQVPVSLYTGGSRGPEQFNLLRSEPFDEPKEKNTLIIKEENLAEKSSKVERSNSILPLDSSAGDNINRDTIKNSFSSHVIRIGKTSTKVQLMDKQYQPSGQIYSIRETDIDFISNNGCKLKFDLAICILEKHFADRRNIFHKLIAAFQAYLIERFQKPETKFGFREMEEVYNWAVDDIKQFVVILYESVKFYYSFIRIKRQHVQEYDSIFSKSNFVNALTSMVFNKDTNALMIQLCRIRTAKIEEFCMRSFKVWKNLDPQQFGVHNKYALNQGTIDHMKKEDSVTFGQDDTIIKNEEIDSGIKFNLKENSIGETSIHAKIPPALDNSLPSEHSFKPYEKATVEICLLRNKTSPSEKYKIILRVGELVIRAIKDFYKGSKDKLDSNLSVNELLPILFYIIVKSESYDIFTHGQLVASFVPKDMLVTPGYEYVKIIETIENFMYTKTLRNSYNIETVGINLQDFLRSSLLKVDASICQDILNEKLEEKRKVSN